MQLAARSDLPILFGTSGWRGVLAEDFTVERARAAVTGVARWLSEGGIARPVFVAHDRRFLGEHFALLAAAVLHAEGIRPILVEGAVATPVVSHGVVRARAGGALVFTASHNPAAYQGLKVLGASGGGLMSEATRRIEVLAADALEEGREAPALVRLAKPRAVDLVAPYLADLLCQIDRTALRRSGLSVVFDALHGTGAGVLDVALRRCGVSVLTLHGDTDPTFGGFAPDPLPERLRALARAARMGSGLRIGLATDGDADRLAVVDGAGRCLSETRTLALLVDHLARTGRVRRGVALSVATGSLVERVASNHGLSVKRLPIGFKYLTQALLDGSADVAGEESGGFALEAFARDKDGIFAGCLLAERVATMRRPLHACVRELERLFGASECGRTSVPATALACDALASLTEAPPSRLGRETVRGADTSCGLRIELADGFLMLRASGTEPVIRLYGEAPDARRLALRLAAGARLLAAR
ncbi:MAG TPA: phosphoglucomutase/phosphomannomutase family protein [Myxococcota bacterium]|nr:phosphoglucomutase/phosphomannomutase family protein [Myxococcota bacterium]